MIAFWWVKGEGLVAVFGFLAFPGIFLATRIFTLKKKETLDLFMLGIPDWRMDFQCPRNLDFFRMTFVKRVD